MNVVTIRSENQVEKFRENDKEFDESFGEKKVEIKENILTPFKKEVVEEVEKEEPYVSLPPYKPINPFPQRFVEVKVNTQSKRYADIMENIITDVPLTRILYKKRIL